MTGLHSYELLDGRAGRQKCLPGDQKRRGVEPHFFASDFGRVRNRQVLEYSQVSSQNRLFLGVHFGVDCILGSIFGLSEAMRDFKPEGRACMHAFLSACTLSPDHMF